MPSRGRNIEGLVAIILGLVFIFSGFVKSIDSVGTSLYVTSHLEALMLGQFKPLALPVAILLGATELWLGVMLVFRLLRRITSALTLVILSFFTIITLLNITLFPLEDCGCFGDVVKLSAEATFAKNLLLMPLAVVLWRAWRRAEGRGVYEWIVAAILLSMALAMNIYVARHFPLIDLSPYRRGTNLREQVAEERARAEAATRHELVFRDVNDGTEHRFASDDASCWMNDSLEYVGVECHIDDSVVLDYADFAIYGSDSRDCSEELLAERGAMIWLCVSSAEALAEEGGLQRVVGRIAELYPDSRIVLLSSQRCGEAAVEHYDIDAATLLSMLRTDVGIIYIVDGVIEDKCPIGDLM